MTIDLHPLRDPQRSPGWPETVEIIQGIARMAPTLNARPESVIGYAAVSLVISAIHMCDECGIDINDYFEAQL